MSSLSTGVVIKNNNSINNKTAPTTTENAESTHSTQSPVSTVDPDDYNPSYNLNRFLADQNYPPGYKKAQSPEEAERNKESELKDFDIKFASNRDSLHG
ncbi:hypothetical protein J3E68DRAFT_432172 [Trichoderma sp. SZMC 28012]